MRHAPTRIVILTSDDKAFALPVWRHTIEKLRRQYEVCGIVVVPERLGRHYGLSIPIWYARTFGVLDSILLFLYAMKKKIMLLQSGVTTWEQLGKTFHIPVYHVDDPNSDEAVALISLLHAGVMFIMVGFILKSPIIHSVSRGVINKHAALLPSCRGLFPYFWATTHGVPLGMSFHVVTEDIDAGQILVRKTLKGRYRSMVQFYHEVFRRFPDMAVDAVTRLIQRKYLSPLHAQPSSYFGLPKSDDAKKFRKKGGRVIVWKDLFLQ